MSQLKIKSTIDIKKLQKKFGAALTPALEKGAIQMLDWSANGSSKVAEKPPIRKGILIGSGSIFLGSKLVDTTEKKHPPKEGTATPNRSYSGKNLVITIGYNTDYAAKMHFEKLKPGPFSERAGNSNPGNNWLAKHLAGDGAILMDTIGRMMKKGLGNG